MAAFAAVVSPLAAKQVKFTNVFATGTALRPVSGSSSLATTVPQQSGLQVRALKKLMGKVVTDTQSKTVTVEVTRIAIHPKYKKRVKTTKNFIVHDPENSAKKGDIVVLAKCAPVSKRKQFVVVEVKTGQPRNIAFSEEAALPPFESVVAVE